MISTFGEFGSRLRNTILTIVIGLTWVVNIVFASFSLGDPVSLYALLVFFIVLFILSLLLEHTMINEDDVSEALSGQIYPSRIRTPLRVGYTPYIAVWLCWWFVTQLFFNAGLVFEYGYITQLLLLPLVVAALSVNSGIIEASLRVRRYILIMLLIVTALTLFFPTRAWAPQHVYALHTVVRVMIFFGMIMLNDSVTPANIYANLSADAGPVAKASPRGMLTQHLAGASIEDGTIEIRKAKIASIVEAYARIDEESTRVTEFIALTAWLLVTPLAAVLLVSMLAIAATFYNGRRRAMRVSAREAQKENSLPQTLMRQLPLPQPQHYHQQQQPTVVFDQHSTSTSQRRPAQQETPSPVAQAFSQRAAPTAATIFKFDPN